MTLKEKLASLENQIEELKNAPPDMSKLDWVTTYISPSDFDFTDETTRTLVFLFGSKALGVGKINFLYPPSNIHVWENDGRYNDKYSGSVYVPKWVIPLLKIK